MAVSVSKVPPGNVTHVARIIRPIGTPHVSGDFTTYSVTVYDDEGVSIYSQAGLTVSAGDPVFDTLQTDGYWQGRDDTGYNFRRVIAASDLGANYFRGGRTYTTRYVLEGGATYGPVEVVFRDIVESNAPVS